MERTIGKAVKQAVNGEPVQNQPAPQASNELPERCCGRCEHRNMRMQFNHISQVCTAHPPQLHPVPMATPQGQGIQFTSMYPPVDERECCGEFKRRPDG